MDGGAGRASPNVGFIVPLAVRWCMVVSLPVVTVAAICLAFPIIAGSFLLLFESGSLVAEMCVEISDNASNLFR